jgi:hypothetical protein
MDYPASLSTVISKAAAQHPQDIDKAVTCAAKAARKLPDFSEWVDQLVNSQLRNMIHDARHSHNTRLRREAGDFGGPAKVGLSTGAANEVAKSVYMSYAIGGTVLGAVLGSELKAIAASEHEKAQGHAFNVRLCSRLAAMVPDDKRVSEALTEGKLKRLFVELQKSKGGKAA